MRGSCAHTACPFTPKYFSVYFLRSRTFSYITTVQLLKERNSALIQYYSNFISCPKNVLEQLFRPVQDLIQDQVHVVVTSLQFPLIRLLCDVDSLPVYKRLFYLFKPNFLSFMAIFKCSSYKVCKFLIECIPKYFTFFVAIINGVFPLSLFL